MKSETKYFHATDFGWNFRITTNEDAQLTYVTRYKTNGHENQDDISVTLFTVRAVTEGEAERIIAEGKDFLTNAEIITKPLNLQGAKIRAEAIEKLEKQDRETNLMFSEEPYRQALANCNI